MKKMDLHHIRKDYTAGSLDEQSIPGSPFELFSQWINQAINHSEIIEPTAMILSTVAIDGSPSSRVVLLKEVSDNGFTFFTNYQSRKGKEISVHNKVSLLFFWPEMQRQIRIEGQAFKLEENFNHEYFNSRPVESQIAAIISKQSEKANSKIEIMESYNDFSEKDQTPVKPAHWGGFRVIPAYFEFWQGGSHRLHDRITYQQDSGIWTIGRLWP
ncbi:MAG: pyridoxamine 5'-phosphate oxidase [Bacteroidetes bacterium HGW-Bacteroidetes-21]|nr:MAG: pyridoxamine 5'-phosphate oxidase [Bacteroidetes bacterium HGW-Bacteroidetes-21]